MTSDAAFYAELAPRLRQAREAQYLPVVQAAARAGIHPKVLRRWEAGKAIPATPGLIRLCHALHIDLDTLFPATSVWHVAQPGAVGASTTTAPADVRQA